MEGFERQILTEKVGKMTEELLGPSPFLLAYIAQAVNIETPSYLKILSAFSQNSREIIKCIEKENKERKRLRSLKLAVPTLEQVD